MNARRTCRHISIERSAFDDKLHLIWLQSNRLMHQAVGQRKCVASIAGGKCEIHVNVSSNHISKKNPTAASEFIQFSTDSMTCFKQLLSRHIAFLVFQHELKRIKRQVHV